MKKIYGWLKLYLKEEFDLRLFGLTAIFLALCIWINYTVHIERSYIEPLGKNPLKILLWMAFYLFPWAAIFFFQCAIKKDFTMFRNPNIWLAILVGVFALSLANWAWIHTAIANHYFKGHAAFFVRKAGWNLKNSIFYVTPILLYRLFIDRQEKGFYGLTIKRFDPKPYLLMLAIMLPLIIATSFTADFQNSYPTYAPNPYAKLWGMPAWLEMTIYEFFYGADFTIVELFFRGFLVIGFAKWMGKEAILPMVGMYCFLHFGKPAGETISSCFGGLLLGVIAYESRSILGGVMVHIGVGLMMDIAAYNQLE